jgi:tetratricopeptide (TPR) repeat protein
MPSVGAADSAAMNASADPGSNAESLALRRVLRSRTARADAFGQASAAQFRLTERRATAALDKPLAWRSSSASKTAGAGPLTEQNVESDASRQAEAYFRAAYAAQMRGALDEAIALYRRSLACVPTAEAHTFLGWALSQRGDYAAAIQECHRAITLDPQFGNPYNDIGSYLIALGQHVEAVPWLRRAIGAPRYEPRHYPHVNLARVYAKLGHVDAAIAQLRAALAIAPHYRPARVEVHRLLGLLN